MNKKEFYKLVARLEDGMNVPPESLIDLAYFAQKLVDIIEEAEDNNGDVFGTEGWEHAIGWD